MSHLTHGQVTRYSRHLVLNEIGVNGQLKLINSSALIVGAGGLGCPAAIYLAAAGVGCIGVVDHDEIELNNLHRQILHTEKEIGKPKVESIKSSCEELNSDITIKTYHLKLSSSNALDIISQYDIVLDCTDNAPTRYLLNDACVLAKRPLISGSALRFEGQLTLYNFKDGPCYRCLFPVPPPAETVTNCSDGGVLGAIPGIIGTFQALEAIKILASLEPTYYKKMLLFDGLSITNPFRVVALRGKVDNCPVCSSNPQITQLIDYVQFCGAKASDKSGSCLELISNEDRISCSEYKEQFFGQSNHLLIDVRPTIELQICQLSGSINVPIKELDKKSSIKVNNVLNLIESESEKFNSNSLPVIFLCKRGNDSQNAVIRFKVLLKENPKCSIKDIKGGITAWSKEIDSRLPIY